MKNAFVHFQIFGMDENKNIIHSNREQFLQTFILQLRP